VSGARLPLFFPSLTGVIIENDFQFQ
jgi:hypothetical protein